MKEKIHPEFYPDAQVVCACGNSWTVGSTVPVIRTDICSKCHPFFTGEQRIVDSGGQVFARQLGRGHGHEDSAVAEPTAFQLKENQTGTVLELSFPASAFIPAGARSLSLIVAGGRRDNLTSYHSMRRGLEIRL